MVSRAIRNHSYSSCWHYEVKNKFRLCYREDFIVFNRVEKYYNFYSYEYSWLADESFTKLVN